MKILEDFKSLPIEKNTLYVQLSTPIILSPRSRRLNKNNLSYRWLKFNETNKRRPQVLCADLTLGLTLFLCFIEFQPSVTSDMLVQSSGSWAQNDRGGKHFILIRGEMRDSKCDMSSVYIWKLHEAKSYKKLFISGFTTKLELRFWKKIDAMVFTAYLGGHFF